MALLGSVPAWQFQVDATSSNIPSSATDPLVISSSLPQTASSIEIYNGTTGVLYLYEGPNANLKRLTIMPGSTFQQRQPCKLDAGARLSIRNAAASAITSGTVIINAWL